MHCCIIHGIYGILIIQESEIEDDEDEAPPPEDLSDHVEKLIDLRKKLDAEVKGNVSEAQKRQKKTL